jgi:tetratricopeptide (TPR) repeat protein
MAAGAQILCVKCGSAASDPSAADCAKCGGRNARVCGKCGNQNSLPKNFCDQCGQSIGALGAIAPPAPTAPFGAAASDIPETEIRRLAAPGGGRQALPVAGTGLAPGQASSGAAPLDDLWSAPKPTQAAPERPPRPPMLLLRATLRFIAAVVGLGAAGYGVWNFMEFHKPENLVPSLATRYLDALRSRDFTGAYALLSDAAKRGTTLDEFSASRGGKPWSWSGLSLEKQDPDAMLFSYSLKPDGAPAHRDRLLFVRQGERWVLPYDAALLRRVGQAFARGDADKAFLLAQQAADVDPRDPAAWSDLCEVSYRRQNPTVVAAKCLKALDAAQAYPGLSPQRAYNLHAILADTYHRVLRDPERAAAQYSAMLSFPGLPPADQCPLLLARCSAYGELSRPGEALTDLERAGQICTDTKNRALIKKLRESLRAPDTQ